MYSDFQCIQRDRRTLCYANTATRRSVIAFHYVVCEFYRFEYTECIFMYLCRKMHFLEIHR